MKLLAYHNDPAVKTKYVNRLAEHRRLEHLVQGTGWKSNGFVPSVQHRFTSRVHPLSAIRATGRPMIATPTMSIGFSVETARLNLWPTHGLWWRWWRKTNSLASANSLGTMVNVMVGL